MDKKCAVHDLWVVGSNPVQGELGMHSISGVPEISVVKVRVSVTSNVVCDMEVICVQTPVSLNSGCVVVQKSLMPLLLRQAFHGMKCVVHYLEV